jgi:hypothetical protein
MITEMYSIILFSRAIKLRVRKCKLCMLVRPKIGNGSKVKLFLGKGTEMVVYYLIAPSQARC